LSFSRTGKQLIALTADVISVDLTVWIAFSLRLESLHHPVGAQWVPYLVAPIIAVLVFSRLGLYRAIFRYSGFAALATLIKACFYYGICFFSIVFFLQSQGVPRSVGLLQPLLLMLATGGSRALVRKWLNIADDVTPVNGKQKKILIYGAGSAGVQIACAMQHNKHYEIVGFLDDNPELWAKTINGVTIYNPANVEALAKRSGITSILLAIPSATHRRRDEMYRFLQGLGLNISTLPGIESYADGTVSISDIREVDIEDLLGREPVPPDPQLFSRCITGKVVMVTGAGGSIGSEICRQILASYPSTLILLDNSEYNLYLLHRELQQRNKHHVTPSNLIPVLANVTDECYMEALCSRYKPSAIYHAAAYKHVPMVEDNIIEGVRNNVMGTFNMAQAAEKNGVLYFVLISTDKAVRPTSIMGASKRLCELVLQAFASEAKHTCFSMVRFGNVLGSSGSVVPLFRRQIRQGGPITLTHPEITRYFMTIPEAAQLVIQAGAMAEGGDVFLLDMGEPIKIMDLARRMVELSGLSIIDSDHPDGDIEITVTGLRPGEKLYEELLIAENPMPTSHPRIFKAQEDFLAWSDLLVHLSTLQVLIKSYDDAAVKELLKKIVKGYTSQPELSAQSESPDQHNGVTQHKSPLAAPQEQSVVH
jgi:FlaA1/EpsC-like NDP-sugar epimerase